MVKMPCLFARTFLGRGKFLLTEDVAPGCEWVTAGEGAGSVKRDGTACLVREGRLWKRYDAKRGKTPPVGGIPCSDPDPETGHWPFWVPIGPHDYWHAEAFARQAAELVEGATYELCGPKVQGNPERLPEHVLLRHGADAVPLAPRTFEGLCDFLAAVRIEGLVFAHPDGRFAKIRRKDFGLPWPVEIQGQA